MARMIKPQRKAGGCARIVGGRVNEILDDLSRMNIVFNDRGEFEIRAVVKGGGDDEEDKGHEEHEAADRDQAQL